MTASRPHNRLLSAVGITRRRLAGGGKRRLSIEVYRTAACKNVRHQLVLRAQMDETYDKKMAVRAKVAFLGLFVLALVAARLVVGMRSAVVLGDPIELEYSGFSVSMPEGNGWRTPRGWDYSDGEITLFGTFRPGSWKATAFARCSYIFPAEIVDLEERFERRRLAAEGEIVDSGQIETDSAIVDWIRIDQAEGYNYIFGTAELPDYRRIEIEVQEGAGDVGLAESVFKAIASSLSVTDNPLLESGARMIAKMKGRGLAETLENQNRQGLFLIRDARRRRKIIGFTTDVLIDTGRSGELNIDAMSMYYIKGVSPREDVTSFKSDNRFDRFTWKTESVARERISIEMVLEGAGILTVTKVSSSSIDDSPKPHRYHTTSATVPEMLIDQLLERMIEDGLEETLVDMITPYGSIVPTHISQIRPDSTADAEDAAYMVKLTPLDGRGFFQLAYLDDQSRISRSLVRGRNTLLLERATPEEAAKEFPERAEFILQNEKLKQYLDDELI